MEKIRDLQLPEFKVARPAILYPDENSRRILANQNIEFMPIDTLVEEVAKAGFDVIGEYDRRFRLREKYGRQHGDKIWIEGVTDEVTEHALEYSKKDVVRVPPFYWLVDNKLYSPRFDAFARNFTSPIERKGSVVTGLKKVEEKLVVSQEGDFVVWASPDGPLGIGSNYYDYAWVHIFWKEKGDNGVPVVRYVSVRSGHKPDKLGDYINNLEGRVELERKPGETPLDFIRTIVEHPVSVSKDKVTDINDLIKAMRLVTPDTNIAYTDKHSKKQVTFDDIMYELSNIDQKQEYENRVVKPITQHFEKLIQESGTYEETLRNMALYVLALNTFWREYQQETTSPQQTNDIVNRVLAGNFSDGLIDDLQQVKGCAANMQNTRNFTRDIPEPFTCSCGMATYDRVGNKCPRCGLTKEEFVKEAREKGEPVCD